MRPAMFAHSVSTQFMSATSLEVSPLTDLQTRQKCKKCRKALGDHQLPYMKCPTKTVNKFGFQRFSKKYRFTMCDPPKTTKLLEEEIDECHTAP